MGRTWKIVVCGQTAVGKTAILEQLINGDHLVGSSMFSTIEDIYTATIDTDRGQKEKIHYYDTAGLDCVKPELPKQFYSIADGFVIVYDVTNEESFACLDKLKRLIEKNREKKEAIIIALGNKCDLKSNRMVEFNAAHNWAQQQKVRLWEVSIVNRQSLADPFVWLATKLTQPPNKSFSVTAFAGNRKLKLET